MLSKNTTVAEMQCSLNEVRAERDELQTKQLVADQATDDVLKRAQNRELVKQLLHTGGHLSGTLEQLRSARLSQIISSLALCACNSFVCDSRSDSRGLHDIAVSDST